MIKAVIFDFAGVISEEGYNNWLKKNTSDSGENYKKYLEIAKEGDKAILPQGKYRNLLSKETGIPSEDIWPNMRKEFIIRKNMITLIEVLKKNYKIGLLSNFPKGWLQEILKEENIRDYFDAVTISSELHVTKPDPKIFLNLLNKLKLKPEEAIFIDDKKENSEGAKKIGMKSIFFTSYEKLYNDLLNLGIL